MIQVRKFPISIVEQFQEMNRFLEENGENIKKVKIVKEDIDGTPFTIGYVIYETNQSRIMKI